MDFKNIDFKTTQMKTTYKNGVISYLTQCGNTIAQIHFRNITANEIESNYPQYANEYFNEPF